MTRRQILFGLVLLAIASAAFTTFRWRAKNSAGAEAPTKTHTVGRGRVEVLLKETGVVLPRQTVAVKSKVSGRVREVRVAEGEAVLEGQLVAIVEPDVQASLTLSEKRMSLRRLALDLEQRERESTRQTRLQKEDLVPKQSAEEAERDYETAKTLFLQAKAALNLLEREANQPLTRGTGANLSDGFELTDYRIVSPISGIVVSVRVKPGEMAISGTSGFSPDGALLMEIADERELEVHVDVNEIDVPRVRPGMTASVTLAARAGKPLAATVDRVAVAPRADAGNANGTSRLIVFPVALKLPERPPELRQGMSATVDLALDAVDDVVCVPVLAVGERDGKFWAKLRGADGTFSDREIETGLRGDKLIEVKSGLEVKDVVAARWPAEPEEE